MIRAVFLAAALTVMSSSVCAWDFRSGDNLLSQCQNPKALGEWGLCWSYIEGVVAAMSLNADDRALKAVTNPSGTERLGSLYGYRACVHSGAESNQLAAVVVEWLEAHPGKLHFGAAGLVAEALEEAFPCPEEKQARHWQRLFWKRDSHEVTSGIPGGGADGGVFECVGGGCLFGRRQVA